jgi:hypothetical protein
LVKEAFDASLNVVKDWYECIWGYNCHPL